MDSPHTHGLDRILLMLFVLGTVAVIGLGALGVL